METVATILSCLSGFVLMRYQGSAVNLAATSIVINVALAPLVAVIASRRNRSAVLWYALGLVFGVWAFAAALLILRREKDSGDSPTTRLPSDPDAA